MHKIYAIASLYSEDMRKMEEKQEEFLLTDASGWDMHDGEEETKPYQVVNGVALYDIRGKMVSEGNFFTKIFGIAAYDDIGNTLAAMSQDEEINKVLISMSTPGGNVSGISDLSDTWKRLDSTKPITVHTPGTLASAGIWLASNSSGGIYASETADVGSIGVILQHVSQEKALDKAGIRVTEIKSAPLKHVGSSAKDLTDEEFQHLQSKVMETSELFKKQIYKTRPNVTPSAFTGETFSAEESLRVGLIDGIATFSDVFETLTEEAVDDNNTSYMEEISMKRKVTAAMFEAAVASGADSKTLEIVSQEEFDVLEVESSEKNLNNSEEENLNNSEGESSTDFEAQASVLSEELAASNATIETLQAEVTGLKVSVASAKSDPLRVIAEERISTMRVALGMTSIDMSAFPVDSMLAEYEALNTQFKSAYKAGGVAPKKKVGEEAVETKATNSSVESARLTAVGIKS